VAELVASQFPRWRGLRVSPVVPGGWDHRSFRLGDDMVARLPSAAPYALQIEKEARWLPRLASSLPLAIPTLVALGEPGSGYPWKWSISRWIVGETVTLEMASVSSHVAARLAEFLAALHRIDSTGGPTPGSHNFFRGGSLATYDAEARKAISMLEEGIDARAACDVWTRGVAMTWTQRARWVHGDLAAGNLLMRDGVLAAVIDFGCMAIGDPACDLAVGWTLFRGQARQDFRAMFDFDAATWTRARAWALWKAAIVAAGLSTTNAVEFADPWRVIEEVLWNP
jgi:aminoglycoside phosphotransferase (APT) family kinase protein